MPKSKRQPVLIDQATYDKVLQYTTLTGITATHAVNRAVSEWMDTVGAVHMEVLAERHSGKLLLPKPPTADGPVLPDETQPGAVPAVLPSR